jgi:hypothetical protein
MFDGARPHQWSEDWNMATKRKKVAAFKPEAAGLSGAERIAQRQAEFGHMMGQGKRKAVASLVDAVEGCDP